MELTSEINYLAALFNSKVVATVKPILSSFVWSTPLAKTLIKSANGNFESWEPDILPATLSEIMIPDELSSFVELCNHYKNLKSPEQIKSVSESIFNYYLKNSLSQIISNSSDNLHELISSIRQLPTSLNNPVDIISLGSLDPNAVIKEELGTLDRIIPTSFEVVKKASPFKGYLPGSVVMWVASPGSGKTASLIQEGLIAANAGYKVLFCALGDMMKFDFITRVSAWINKVPFDKVIINPTLYFNDIVKQNTKNFELIILPSKKISSNEIKSIVDSNGDKYDVIIIDYDSNLKDNVDIENMYQTGGEIYEVATEIARPINGCRARVVHIASQPKVQFWGQELLTLDSAGESSRKQHTVDMMITMGKVRNPQGQKVAIMNIPKIRRGIVDIQEPVVMDDSGHITSISTGELSLIRGAVK